MPLPRDETSPGDAAPKLPIWVALPTFLVFALLLFGGPSYLQRLAVTPWLGAAAACLAVIIWVRCVSVGPGFVQGIISIWGLCALVGIAIVLVWRALRGQLAGG